MTVSKHHFPTSNFYIVINMAWPQAHQFCQYNRRSKQLLKWLYFSHNLTTTYEVSHSFLPGTSPLLLEAIKKAHMALNPFLNWKGLKWRAYLKYFAVCSTFSFLSYLSDINNMTFHKQLQKLYSEGFIVLLERAVTNTSQFITKYTPKLSTY